MSTTPAEAPRKIFRFWMEAGVIRALDFAFADFIDQQIPLNTAGNWLACVLVSEGTEKGHVCLDLKAVLATPRITADKSCPPDAIDAIENQFQQIKAHLTDVQQWSDELANHQAIAYCWGKGKEKASSQKDNTPLVLAGSAIQPLLYLRRYWNDEQAVRSGILRRLNLCPVPEQAKDLLTHLFPPNQHHPDWQQIACSLAIRSHFSMITGGPGTGKTTTVVKLLTLLQGLQLLNDKPPLLIKLAAPTGKAAARLSESIANALTDLSLPVSLFDEPQGLQWRHSIPYQVTTLHQLLGSRYGSRQFKHNRTNPLVADLVVIDEASMIDLEMMASLIEALAEDTRLVLLGDKDQLASVEAGSVLGDLCLYAQSGHYLAQTADYIEAHTGQSLPQEMYCEHPAPSDNWLIKLAQSTTMLRHSYRTEGKGLLDCANWINQQQIDRQGMGAFKALFANHSNTLCWLVMPEMDSTADRQVSSNRYDWRELEQRVVSGYRGYLQMLSEVDMCEDEQGLQQWARALLNKYRQFQLLVAVRQGEFGVEALNQRVRQWLVNHGLLTNADATWYQGRPVILTRNDYHLGLMNGDIGICVSMPTEQNNAANAYRVVFAKIDNQGNYTGLHWILPSRLQWVESVYAMTVHKSQGSEFEHTALVLPDRHNPTLTKELLYTAITRSKQQFTLVTPSQRVLEDTLSTKVQRVSGLMR